MTTKKTILTALFLLVAGTVAMYGQIPAEVTDLIEKSKAKMQHASGVTMEMNVHVSILLIKTDMAMTVSEKGGKSLSKASMKMMGRELVVEKGFDGQQEWQYTRKVLKPEDYDKGEKPDKDTLYITKTAKKSKDKHDINFGIAKEYRKATMKLEGKYYVITLTDPVDKKETPKKTTVKIDKDNYYMREIAFKMNGASVRMVVNRVRIGVSDDTFVLDLAKYPNAVVVRK